MTVNEFARPFRADRLHNERVSLSIEANAAERAALARRFDLLALDRLEAELTLRRGAGGVVRLSGHFVCEATQACIATLEPVPAHIEADFEASYAEDAAADEIGDVEIDIDAEDPPEPIENGVIDLGEAVVQQMALALDPYPRSPEAPPPVEEEGGGTSPFAALKQRR